VGHWLLLLLAQQEQHFTILTENLNLNFAHEISATDMALEHAQELR
jgi:hypothetical protein